MFAAEAQHIAALTVMTLKDMRTEEAFGLFLSRRSYFITSDTEDPIDGSCCGGFGLPSTSMLLALLGGLL